MEKVRPWCGQPSDRGRLKNRTERLVNCHAVLNVKSLIFLFNLTFTQSILNASLTVCSKTSTQS